MGNSWYLIDIGIVVLYLIFCLVVGFYKSRSVSNIREYALGKGSISVFALVCTLLATDIGAGFTMGAISKIYTMGLVFILAQLFIPLLWWLTSLIYPRGIEDFYGCMTLGQVMQVLYGKYAKFIANSLNIFASVGVIAAQIMAMGFISEYFFKIDKLYCIIIGCAIMVSYTSLGGVRAVVLTEILQFMVFYFGIPLGCLVTIYEIASTVDGGIFAAYQTLPIEYRTFEFNRDFLIFLPLAIYAIQPHGDTNVFMQRFLMAKSSTKLKKALLVSAVTAIPFTLFICLLGLLIRIKEPNMDPSQVFVYFIDHSLPVGMKGIIIAGLLAIIMSTADSWMNASAVVISNEIVRKYYPQMSDRTELRIARASTVILTLLAACCALVASGIIELIWFIDNFRIPILTIPLILGFLGFKTNARSFIICSVFALASTLTAAYITGEFATTSMIIGMSGSLVGLFGAHYIQKIAGVNMPNGWGIGEAIAKKKNDGTGLFRRLNRVWLSSAIYGEHNNTLGGVNGLYSIALLASTYCFMILLPLVSEGVKLSFLNQVEMVLRLISYGLAFILLAQGWFKRYVLSSKLSSVTYFFLLLMTLAFTPAYLTFLSNYATYQIVSWVLSTILLYSIIGSMLNTFIWTFIAMMSGFALYHLTLIFNTNLDLIHSSAEHSSMAVYTCYTLTFIALGFEKLSAKKEQKKLAERRLYGDSLAHELRSPLSTTKMVIGTVAGILSQSKINPEEIDFMKKMFEKLDRSTVEGLIAIEAILEQVREEQGDQNYDYHDFYECAMMAKEYCELETDATIQIDKEGSFKFQGSKVLMMNVIVNLIMNSVKHGKADYIHIWFKHGTEVHVADNGSGIDASVRRKIFENYYTTNPDDNTGIGLSFSKRVVEKFNGSIACIPPASSEPVYINLQPMALINKQPLQRVYHPGNEPYPPSLKPTNGAHFMIQF